MSAMDLSGSKNILRKQIKQLRKTYNADEKKRIDRNIAEHVISSDMFSQAKSIFVYCSTAAEIDTTDIISKAFETGKTVCTPRCENSFGIMTARRIASVDDLHIGKFDIFEPSEHAPIIPTDQIDLCIVPCLAADHKGFRLGYGGGYYDRFLSHFSGTIAALCPESCLLQGLPIEPYDVSCDYIITERRILTCETN